MTKADITDLENRKSVKSIKPRVWIKFVVFGEGRKHEEWKKGQLKKALRNQSVA